MKVGIIPTLSRRKQIQLVSNLEQLINCGGYNCSITPNFLSCYLSEGHEVRHICKTMMKILYYRLSIPDLEEKLKLFGSFLRFA